MIVRNSPRVPQPSAGEGREHSVRSRPKVTLRAPKHGAVNTEFADDRGDQVANALRLVFVEFGRSGFAVPCLYRSFHGGRYGIEAVQPIAR